jgi:hypothetical protein
MLNVEKMVLTLLANLANRNRRADADQVCEVCAEVIAELTTHFGGSVMDDAELRENIAPQVRRAVIRWEMPSTI